MIWGMIRSRNAVLANRNTAYFSDLGSSVVNLWNSGTAEQRNALDEAQMIELIVTLCNYLVFIDPYVAVSGEHVHVSA